METPPIPPEVLEKLVELARVMRAEGRDKYRLAHAVLYLNERCRLLEEVYRRAEEYLRFGMEERELTALRLAVEKMRRYRDEEADALATLKKKGGG